MALTLGYKASAEQFGPRELLDFAVLAEKLGLESVAVSDHFQPWRHHGGHSPNSIAWPGALAERTERVQIGTSVLTPTLRYHPSIVSQAFATLGLLAPGRMFLGVGTGEALNETPATAGEWPSARERRRRLVEAIELIRQLWRTERLTFDGEYYRTDRATIYDRPDEPVPIYVAASGPLAARVAGRLGDGMIATSGKPRELYEELMEGVLQGMTQAGRHLPVPKIIEIKVSYDRDPQYALDACRWWAALALTAEEKSGVDDPIEMERLADEAAGRAHTRFIVTNDPDEVVERMARYVQFGFEHMIFHAPGEDQARFLEQFCADVVPKIRERY
jgi:coenzyme F420-dependent glucose-6-phosphate dehydrogenase